MEGLLNIMKLKFKQQQYQSDSVTSVVDCFTGQPKGTRKDILARETEDFLGETKEIEIISFGNHNITLTPTERRTNIQNIQKNNYINYTDNANLNDFTIEMETGTGKTYTYIKTMYELNNTYGWSKFIVMVPSVAIREGVQKSFQITQEHFQEIYQKKIRFFVYNSANSSNIANINSFATDDSIQVMIINYQAFAAKGAANRRIYDELDEMQSNRPIDVIKSVRPILIIDEPQKFGDKTESLLTEFNPLFTLRYSATHKENKTYNQIYRLDAVDAYNQKLVKKINVKGLEVINSKSTGTYLFLDSIDISQKHAPIAKMEIEVKTATGIKRKLLKINANDSLYTKSNELTAYNGYTISEIDSRTDKVTFTNGTEIFVGQAQGTLDRTHITRIQIRETIQSHLEKEKTLFKMGIKVLSLFFIDEVSKYKYYEDNMALKGEYAQIFEEEYLNALADFRTVDDKEYNEYLDSFATGNIHAGYFSIDKKGKLTDPKINQKKEYLSFDEDAYDLIMKDKERLLSLAEPVRFIFSHSALREGWDNPNIFQICTLKHSNSKISKRQEIGRGLRICVNNNGERMDYQTLEDNFHAINTLTIIASESYDTFAKDLQKEIADSLSERPNYFKTEIFVGKELANNNGEKLILTEELYDKVLAFNSELGYVEIEDNSKITPKLIKAIEANNLKVIPELQEFKTELTTLLKESCFKKETNLINDERKTNIRGLTTNDNFMKAEFQELWHKINFKSAYEVNFDTAELVEKSVIAINAQLTINKTRIRVTEGTQKDSVTLDTINANNSMTEVKNQEKIINAAAETTIKYDLIGELTKTTKLTRKTIIKILTTISKDKFELYKHGPEEFIKKVADLINQEKATIIIDGITYHKLEQKYSNDIFTVNTIQGKLGENAFDVKKHIYDFLITDSNLESEFAQKLEKGEVTVYAKLPSGFKIPTPVGNYIPDWAIVFDNLDFKYIYFIDEKNWRGNIIMGFLAFGYLLYMIWQFMVILYWIYFIFWSGVFWLIVLLFNWNNERGRRIKENYGFLSGFWGIVVGLAWLLIQNFLM
jgi:Restriction endonuclease